MTITFETINTVENPILVDIREEYERVNCLIENTLFCPMGILMEEIKNFSENNNYILFCQSGNRSLNMVKLIKSKGHHNFYSLDGGANLLKEKGV